MKKTIVLAMATAVATSGFAISLNEGFDVPAGGLPAGWSSLNVSPGGPGAVPNWEVTADVFPPHAGSGYARAHWQMSTGANDIRAYLISPIDDIDAGDLISFYARSTNSPWPDRMRLMLSPNGGSTAADFTVTALTINPNLLPGVFLNVWTQFTYTFTAADIGASNTSRVAFFYDVTNGGPAGANSDWIGVDTVTSTPVPEPATMTALALGIGALVARRRRK